MDVRFDHRARGVVDVLDSGGGIVGSMIWTGAAWEVWSHVEPEGGPVQKVAQTSYAQATARSIAQQHFARVGLGS